MSRSQLRVSRSLIVVLALALVLGMVAFLHKPNKIHAAEKPIGDSAAAKTAMAATLAVTPTGPSRLDAPAHQAPAAPVGSWQSLLSPATQPTKGSSVSSNVPSTRPAALPPTNLALISDTTPATSTESTATGSAAPATGSLIDQANARIKANQLLEARSMLNDGLIAGQFQNADVTAARQLIAQINKTVVFSPTHFGTDPFGGTYVVKSGETLAKIASAHDVTWELLSRINNLDPKKLRANATLKILNGPFHVIVDKTKFTMDVYLGAAGGKGSMYITTFSVGLGKDDSTPPGTWMVEPHKKIKHPTYYSPRGEGVIPASDPKNPLGPFWIGLTGTDGQAVGKMSYGIHGTIDPDSIGKMASMGCIRMHNEDVAIVYELLVEGKSMVIVKDK